MLAQHETLPANATTVRESRDGGDGTDDAVHLLVAHALVIVDLLGGESRVSFRVEGGHSADGADQHAHGVGIVAEGVRQLLQILVDVGVAHHAAVEVLQLTLR